MSNTVKIRSDLLHQNPKYQKASNKQLQKIRHGGHKSKRLRSNNQNNAIIEEKWEVKRCSLKKIKRTKKYIKRDWLLENKV